MKIQNISLISVSAIVFPQSVQDIVIFDEEVQDAIESESLPDYLKVWESAPAQGMEDAEYTLCKGSERLMALMLKVREVAPRVGEVAPCIILTPRQMEIAKMRG